MFNSVLLLTSMSTIARENSVQSTSSLMEHLMRVTHKFSLKCFKEIQLKGAPSVVGYLSCGKKNTLSFTSRESGMIRKIYISKAKRLICELPSCSIESSGRKKRPWDGTGLCARSNKTNLHSGKNVAYISSSSHYSKIIYGIEDHVDYDCRILTLEMDRAGGNCEHVIHRSGIDYSHKRKTIYRTTCGLTVGPCNKEKTDKCFLVCVCAIFRGQRICQTTIFEEPEFDQGNLTLQYTFQTILRGSDSILSISMDRNQMLYVLTSTRHHMLVKMYVKGRRNWKFLKANPMDNEALYFGIAKTNSNMLITKKNNINIVSFSKTIFKNENDLVCWCNDGSNIAIVNRLYPFERELTSM